MQHNLEDADRLSVMLTLITLVILASLIALTSRTEVKMNKRIDDIGKMTIFLTLLTFLLCLSWIYSTFRDIKCPAFATLEPLITTLGLITGFWALIVKPEIDQREKRDSRSRERTQLLASLDLECSLNGRVLMVPRIQTTQKVIADSTGFEFVGFEDLEFPRLSTSVIERALTSGLFTGQEDGDLRKWFVSAKLDFDQFNWRLTALQVQMHSGSAETNVAEHQKFLESKFVERVERVFNGIDLAVSKARGFDVI